MRSILTAVSATLLLGLGISTCKAAFVPINTPGPVVTSGGNYGGSTSNPVVGGSFTFDDGLFFSSLSSFKLDTTVYTSTTNSTFSSIAYYLYKGAALGTGTLVANITPTFVSGKHYTADYESGNLGPGDYYFEFKGTTTGKGKVTDQITFNVLSAVPLPATLPMFGLALLALGGVSLVSSRKGSGRQIEASGAVA